MIFKLLAIVGASALFSAANAGGSEHLENTACSDAERLVVSTKDYASVCYTELGVGVFFVVTRRYVSGETEYVFHRLKCDPLTWTNFSAARSPDYSVINVFAASERLEGDFEIVAYSRLFCEALL
ncbi:MAG: hypothetical protein AAF667_11395 [Pseudomonadota bacterium]